MEKSWKRPGDKPKEEKNELSTGQEPESSTPTEVAPTPEAETEIKTPFNPHGEKFHLKGGIGDVTLKGNSESVLERNYKSTGNVELGFSFETPTSQTDSIDAGLSLMLFGAKLNSSSSTTLNLSYWAFPVFYKMSVAKVKDYSSIYIKFGGVPLVLNNASVNTCDSSLCGNDSDLDTWLTKRESATSSFQSYSILGAVGAGFNFLLFKEFIVDSVWFTVDASYFTSLANINKGSDLAKELKLSGAQVSVGLAITF